MLVGCAVLCGCQLGQLGLPDNTLCFEIRYESNSFVLFTGTYRAMRWWTTFPHSILFHRTNCTYNNVTVNQSLTKV